MDDITGNLFSLFCSTWRAVLKTFVRLFQIKQVKAWKFTKKKNGETETKKVLANLRMPKLQENSTTVAIVCHCYERLSFLCSRNHVIT